ncbi:MAG: hypothetical protein NVS2B16_16060 [Chloroflexota bacterium]
MLRPLQRVQVRIVTLESILPHEIADSSRERHIEQRLRADQVLRDPLIVGAVPDLDGYVLLDGTNRKRALSALDVPWAMVQVLQYADPHAVELRSWCHAARLALSEFLPRAATIGGVEVARLHPLEAGDALRDASTLAVLLDRNERVVLRRQPNAGTARMDQLCALVALYEERMAREDCDPDAVEERATILQGQGDGPVTFVAFPTFLRSHVVAMATEGCLVPAGITRHIILGGRALRINLPLTVLDGSRSLSDANQAFERHLATLHPRHYEEPTVLFDS